MNYLQEPEAWRAFDPPVFDCLRTAVIDRKERNIRAVEESGLLSNTSFYSPLLTDVADERQGYFDGFLKFSRGKELVFFDPDNGLEIKSVKYGRKGASLYLFLREVSQSFLVGPLSACLSAHASKAARPLHQGPSEQLDARNWLGVGVRVPYSARSIFPGATERATKAVCGNCFQSSHQLGRPAEYKTIHVKEWHHDDQKSPGRQGVDRELQ